MTVDALDQALAASQAWLLDQEAPEAVVLAHEAGADVPRTNARHWVSRVLGEQRDDGSWGGDLLRTIDSLLTIQELRTAARLVEQDPGVARAHDWIRGRRGLPGTWADGCSSDRHRQGLCHHFSGGFYSPADPDVMQPGARLRCGAEVAGDGELRFVASALALRCVLGAGREGQDDRLHLAGLRQVVRVWAENRPGDLSVGGLLAAIHALIASDHPADRDAAQAGLRLVGSKQRGDGSWVETDAFQALDVIGTAVAAGIDVDRMNQALWHGARLLVSSQQKDGSWGRDHGPRRALIGWRTLRRLAPSRLAKGQAGGQG